MRLGPFGKPEVASETGQPALRFSLSHTRGAVAVAVTLGAELGVDIEPLGRPAPIEVAERLFSPEEKAVLREKSDDAQAFTFFSLWTLRKHTRRRLAEA